MRVLLIFILIFGFAVLNLMSSASIGAGKPVSLRSSTNRSTAVEAEDCLAGIDPDSVSALLWYEHGIKCLRHVVAYEKAILAFQRALDLDPDNPEALKGLGLANLINIVSPVEYRRFERAVPALERAVEFLPNDPEAHVGLAWAYAAVGKYELAIAHCQRSLELDPSLTISYCLLSSLYEGGGELDKAVETRRKELSLREENRWKAPERQPYDVERLWRGSDEYLDHFELGDLLTRMGRYTEALESYLEMQRIEPDEPLGHRKAGEIFVALGRKDAALAEYNALVAASA